MIKKISNGLIALTFLATMFSIARAGDRTKEAVGDIGPAWVSGIAVTSGTAVTLSSAGSGNYNCLDYFHVSSTNTYTVYILNGNTTAYSLTFPSTITHDPNFNPPLCGSAATSMTLKVIPSASSTTINTSYKGMVGR
jgi:hypothetical protein